MLTNDEVTRLAQETGLHLPYWDDKDADETGEVGGPPAGWTMVSPFGLPLERFAHAVEREAYKRAVAECRALAQKYQTFGRTMPSNATSLLYASMGAGVLNAATAIEALGREA